MIVRWWPPVAVAAMLVLGLVVRTGPVPVDRWFLRLGHDMGRWRLLFLLFTEWRLMVLILVFLTAMAAYRRRWWLAGATVLAPPLAIAVVQVLKRVFGRYKGSGLAYPSGHTTTVVVVMGLLVLAAGCALWAVILATTVSALGMFGQAISHHYFTDTVGAVLLGTAVICLVAVITARDRAPAIADG